MTEDDDGVPLVDGNPVLGGVHRLECPAVDACLAEEPDGVVRGVPARAGADRNDPATFQPLGLLLDRSEVIEQRAQVGGLPPDRVAHDARHSTDPAASVAGPPGCLPRHRPSQSRFQSPGQGISLPPVTPLGRSASVTRSTIASTRFVVPDGGS